ncbi:MAG: hypothetical protein PVF69_00870 [Gemmatimonadota bacterium]|jgi:hypothetical protein
MFDATRSLQLLALGIIIASCAPSEDGAPAEDMAAEESRPGVMNVVARGLSFAEAPSEVPAGWTTLHFANESDVVHFAIVERLPEGQSLASQQAQIAPVFQDGMDFLSEGDADAAVARFGELPPWFGEIVFMGGPGLTSPGHESDATIFLEPGTYLLECYVKTNGIFHSYNPDPDMYGMVHEFTVTSDTTAVSEPTADVDITISSTDGIQVAGDVGTGARTVAVHFQDQVAHENFVGHDVHLARLDADDDLATLEAWMNWTAPAGLQTPAPVEFVGGLNEMPAGSTGYFDVTLSPGRYAWVAEVPGSLEKGMLQEFAIR